MKYKLLGVIKMDNELGERIILYILDDGHGHVRGYREHNLPSRQARRIVKLAG